jgi:hypothetical protein
MCMSIWSRRVLILLFLLQACARANTSASATHAGTAANAAGKPAQASTMSQAGAPTQAGAASLPRAGTAAAAAGGGGNAAGPKQLHWYMSCGDPMCRLDDKPFDDPNISNCTTQKLGDVCSGAGDQCDGVAQCGAKLICAAADPSTQFGGCPMSRARFKEQIEYLTEEQRRAFRDQLLRIPLASYRYKHAPEAGPQLGFVIEDIEPSNAVSGDHVNMYGYLSMAVAAIQEQQHQIAELEREVAVLRARVEVRGGRAVAQRSQRVPRPNTSTVTGPPWRIAK